MAVSGVLLIGEPFVGKTQLALHIKDATPLSTAYLPTLGVHFVTKHIKLDNEMLKMVCYDTPGFYTITHKLIVHHAKMGDGAILIFDVTNRQYFLNLKSLWLPTFSHVMGTSFQFMLVGNKCDLVEEREVDYTTAKEFADSLNILYIEVSAKDGTNVEMMFVQMTALTRNKSKISIKLDKEENKEKSSIRKKECLCTCL